MEHAGLIARLGAAAEGGRELDEEIASNIAGATLERQAGGRAAYHRDGHWVSVGKVLPYTTALDAALTLVPEGMDWSVVRRTRYPYRGEFNYEAVVWNVRQQGFAQSGPLALCIAALKARQP